MVVKTYKYIPFSRDKEFLKLFDKDDCVIFYGTLSLAKQIEKEATWIPGLYCDLEKMKCSYYYPIFGDYLLNSDYWMLPYGDLKRKKNQIFQYFSTGDYFPSVFMRPDSGFKSFTGFDVSFDRFDEEIHLLTMDTNPNDIILFSSPKNILREYRIIIVDCKPISGSQYKENFLHSECGHVPEKIFQFCKKVTNSIDFISEPYTMDIAELDDGTLKVIEVNSFSCSGLYLSPLEKIVEEVSRKAVKDWKEIYD